MKKLYAGLALLSLLLLGMVSCGGEQTPPPIKEVTDSNVKDETPSEGYEVFDPSKLDANGDRKSEDTDKADTAAAGKQ